MPIPSHHMYVMILKMHQEEEEDWVMSLDDLFEGGEVQCDDAQDRDRGVQSGVQWSETCGTVHEGAADAVGARHHSLAPPLATKVLKNKKGIVPGVGAGGGGTSTRQRPQALLAQRCQKYGWPQPRFQRLVAAAAAGAVPGSSAMIRYSVTLDMGQARYECEKMWTKVWKKSILIGWAIGVVLGGCFKPDFPNKF
jgi:hypothetical protein